MQYTYNVLLLNRVLKFECYDWNKDGRFILL